MQFQKLQESYKYVCFLVLQTKFSRKTCGLIFLSNVLQVQNLWRYSQVFLCYKLLWEEHENTSKDSEPAKRLKENLSHKFSWKMLFAAPDNKCICKIIEASEIALKRPSLKEQIESKKLLLFRNGVI